MRRVTLLLVLAAVSAPSSAHAANYIALTVSPTRVVPGWTLSATVTNGSFSRGDEIVGLTLRRSFLRGRGEELHALRAHPRQTTISFDGQSGRWATNRLLGRAGGADLAIEATGEPTAVTDAWGCQGAFVRIPVVLRGTLSLHTGTRLFKTVKRTRLAGHVTVDDGAVSCDLGRPTDCEPSTSLHAGRPEGSLLASPRRLGLQFREPVAGSVAAWYHVLGVGGYGVLSGTPPTIGVAGPSLPAFRGSARFAGETTTVTNSGACRTTTTTGAATGSFRATFAGWGVRTLRLQPGAVATFSETR
jgi:hypothetical protein